MKYTILLLFVFAGNVFGASSVAEAMADRASSSAASSSSAAASSSSAGSSDVGSLPPVLMPVHKVSLYELCQYAIIKAHKVREAEDVEQREELGVLVPLWKRDIKKTVKNLNDLLGFGIMIPNNGPKPTREKWTRYTKLLIKKGANPDLRLSHTYTSGGVKSETSPLLWFLGHIGDYEMANLLLDAGADVTVVSEAFGSTALHLVCDRSMFPENAKMLQRLLRLEADPNKLDKKGRTPLHRYVDNIIEQINNDSDSELYMIPFVVADLKHAGCDITIRDANGKTVADLLQGAKQAIDMTKIVERRGRTGTYEVQIRRDALNAALAILEGREPLFVQRDPAVESGCVLL